MSTDHMEHPNYDTAVDALCEGIKKGTQIIIDTLGITVNLTELQSWGNYELLRRKMYSGPTSKPLYRFLFPHRYKQLYRAFIEAQLAVQEEFLVMVLDKGNESLETQGPGPHSTC